MEPIMRYACNLAEDILDIAVSVLDTPSEIETICQKYRFHPVQKFLYPSALETLFQAMQDTDLVCLTDPLHITFHFFMLQDVFICFGPYCIDTLSSKEVSTLFQQLEIDPGEISPFLAYRSQFQIIPEQKVLNHIYGLIHHISPASQPHQLRRIGYEERAFVPQRPMPEKKVSYAQVIKERYAMEEKLSASIKAGNYTSALKAIHFLIQDVEYLLSIGNRSENMKTAMIILGTQLRIYAVNAGLSPVLIDQITNNYFEKQLAEKTTEGQQQVIEDMLKALCKEVRMDKSGRFSSVTLTIQYYIDHHFDQELSLTDLARDLNLSYNYMIAHFKKEMGITPGAYLIDTRLRHAEWLLVHSEKSIAQISTESGIPDPNYFTKLFKRKYGKTPTQYRKHT